MPDPRVLAIGDSDSRWKWAAAVAPQVTHDGVVDAVLLDTGSRPTSRQLADVDGHLATPRLWGLRSLAAAQSYADYDVVVVGATGGAIHRVIGAVADLGGRRPIVVTGYVGLVYEKYLEGLLWRVGADVICVNSATDYARFACQLHAVGSDPQALVRSGVPFIADRVPVEPREVATITFAVQPDVPRRKADREYLLARLVEYAEAFPDRRVVVKLRAQPDEPTTHRERHHYTQLADESTLPPNLEFVYGNMRDVLAETDLCLTVSSTAALEALALGIPTGIVTDFGVRESLGNHFFVGSGCLVSFADLLADDLPAPDQAWLDRNGLGRDDHIDNVRDRVEVLLKTREAEGLPGIKQWIVPGRADALVADHERRYGHQPLEQQVQPTRFRPFRRTMAAGFDWASPLYRRFRRWLDA